MIDKNEAESKPTQRRFKIVIEGLITDCEPDNLGDHASHYEECVAALNSDTEQFAPGDSEITGFTVEVLDKD